MKTVFTRYDIDKYLDKAPAHLMMQQVNRAKARIGSTRMLLHKPLKRRGDYEDRMIATFSIAKAREYLAKRLLHKHTDKELLRERLEVLERIEQDE